MDQPRIPRSSSDRGLQVWAHTPEPTPFHFSRHSAVHGPEGCSRNEATPHETGRDAPSGYPRRRLCARTLRKPCRILALIGLGAALAACRSPAVSEAGSSPVLRVMSYNIRHGEGMDGRVDLERIARVIQEQEVDLVALQEVDRGVARTDRVDQPAELAALTGMAVVFSNNYAFQGGEYGNAILSRWPVLAWNNRHYRMQRTGEQRGLLEARIDWQGRPLRFMSTHLDHRPDDTERLANVTEIREEVLSDPDLPVVLAGDFNDYPGRALHRQLQAFLADTWERVGQGPGYTFSSRQPDRRIDYVWLAEGRGFEPVRAWVVGSEASDHSPLVVEFRWIGPPSNNGSP